MDLHQLSVLAVVQGITEFLPISSSAHLILVPAITGWADQGLALDVATHLGSLVAVLVYFRRDALQMMREAAGRAVEPARRSLLLKVAVATVPVVLAGFALKGMVETTLRDALVIAWMTIVFGVLLYLADRNRGTRTVGEMGLRDAALIGVAQALAIIPGVSRSGVTMTAARFLGYSRPEAAHFSLLMAIPTILAASALIGLELQAERGRLLDPDLWIAAALSFIAALLAIALMMEWLRRASFTPFVVYRLLLGVVLLAWLY
jgi:undecaprenyl-diphosphatase